jgi:hypothetical protein
MLESLARQVRVLDEIDKNRSALLLKLLLRTIRVVGARLMGFDVGGVGGGGVEKCEKGTVYSLRKIMIIYYSDLCTES